MDRKGLLPRILAQANHKIALTLILLLPAVAHAAEPGEALIAKILALMTGAWGAALYSVVFIVLVVGAAFNAWRWSRVVMGVVAIVLIFGAATWVTWMEGLA